MGTEDGQVYKALFYENEQLLFAKPGDKIIGTLVNGKLIVEFVNEPNETEAL